MQDSLDLLEGDEANRLLVAGTEKSFVGGEEQFGLLVTNRDADVHGQVVGVEGGIVPGVRAFRGDVTLTHGPGNERHVKIGSGAQGGQYVEVDILRERAPVVVGEFEGGHDSSLRTSASERAPHWRDRHSCRHRTDTY